MVTKHQGRATKDFLDILCHLVRHILFCIHWRNETGQRKSGETKTGWITEHWNEASNLALVGHSNDPWDGPIFGVSGLGSVPQNDFNLFVNSSRLQSTHIHGCRATFCFFIVIFHCPFLSSASVVGKSCWNGWHTHRIHGTGISNAWMVYLYGKCG